MTFDEFTMKFYDNDLQYMNNTVDTSIEGMVVLKQIKEQVPDGYTGFINSFVIFKTSLYSWIDTQELFDANIKQLQLKLFRYTSLSNEKQNLECDDIQYSWYMATFSYQVDKDIIFWGQYMFMDNENAYLISLSSETDDDIKQFVKSIKTLACVK